MTLRQRNDINFFMENDDNNNQDIELIPDEEGDTTALQAKIKKLKADLKKSEGERKEYLEGWQRAKADGINYKRDEGKRLEDMARFIAMGLIQDIMPVLDSFDLALGHGLPSELARGVLLIRSQFEDILRKRGLEEIATHPGEEFDPARHESIGEMQSDVSPGAIAEVVQKGYLFRGNVLRPARVRLSIGK